MTDNQGKQITINDIIDYIETNKKFINQPGYIQLNDNDIQRDDKLVPLVYKETKELINLPTNLNSIFTSMLLCRTGVISTINIPSNINITYVSSILTLLDPEFTDMKETKQIKFVEVFIRKLHKETRCNYDTFAYKELGWVLKEFRNQVMQFKIGRSLMKYIADYLHINIFLLDIENDTLIYIGEKIYTKYKKNIFLLKVDNLTFEPLTLLGMSVIEHTTSIINKLLNSRFLVERLDCDLTQKEEFNFIVGEDDISKYIIGDIGKQEQQTEQEEIANQEDIDTEKCLSDDMNYFEEDVICNKEYDIANGVTDIVEFSEENKNDDEIEPEKEEQLKVDSSYTIVKLKKIASNKGIVLSYKKNGKTVGKTKGMLIDEINSM